MSGKILNTESDYAHCTECGRGHSQDVFCPSRVARALVTPTLSSYYVNSIRAKLTLADKAKMASLPQGWTYKLVEEELADSDESLI